MKQIAKDFLRKIDGTEVSWIAFPICQYFILDYILSLFTNTFNDLLSWNV